MLVPTFHPHIETAYMSIYQASMMKWRRRRKGYLLFYVLVCAPVNASSYSFLTQVKSTFEIMFVSSMIQTKDSELNTLSSQP